MSSGTGNIRGMIKYSSRDYNSIMEDFWALVPTLTDLWKPEADSDPGVVLGKFLASAADMLGVNLDWLANEMFGPSVSQRKNAEKLFGLIGYTLGWYSAARTEVTFRNDSDTGIVLDFGFNGANFATLNAYTDITQQPRVITYNILPKTSSYGTQDTRSRREVTTKGDDIFAAHDKVELAPNQSVTRVAIEGELRYYSVSVKDVKANNYIIKLPSQHIDTTAVWVEGKSGSSSTASVSVEDKVRWLQVESASEFIEPEPRFAVSYDNYGNAQIQISNYLNQLESYSDNWLVVYWIDCSGVVGSVGEDVLENFQPAIPAGTIVDGSTVNSFGKENLSIHNLSNTVELPHTHTVTGKSPETAKQAYYNSRKYINTWDSLITLPDFNRFLNREPSIDCGIVIDCQKALEINLAIYEDTSLTDAQKAKMYITSNDFPLSDSPKQIWDKVTNIRLHKDEAMRLIVAPNFKTYTAMCFAVHNDFKDSHYGPGRISTAEFKGRAGFKSYKPPQDVINAVIADYRPLQAMSVDLDFGFARIFPWFVVGTIYPKNPVDESTEKTIVSNVKEALAIHFAPVNRAFGQKPTIMEVVQCIESADSNIKYFDAGSLKNNIITWGERTTIKNYDTIVEYDIEFFNPISFAQYKDPGSDQKNIRVAPEWVLKN